MDDRYVIAHKDGGYLFQIPQGAWDRTPSLQKAAKLTCDKAKKILKNSISHVMRDLWEIVPLGNIDDPENQSTVVDPTLDWTDISNQQRDLYRHITQYRINLDIELSNIDKEITDIEHYIEFFCLDAAKGYKAYRMLRERLTKRRHIKDEMYRADYIINGNATEFSDGTVAKRLNALDQRQYEPRVLSELFGLENTSRTAHICTAH